MKEWLKQLLTKVLSNGFLVLLIIAVLYILFLRECKKPEPCPAKDEIIVPLNVWNEIQKLASKPPEVHIDTIYIKGETIYVNPPALPPVTVDPKDTTVNIYSDTLLKKDIDVSYTFKIRGELLNRKWAYKPIQTIVRIDSIIYVPKIIEIEKIVTKPTNGLYVYGAAGGNSTAFLFGGGADFITKKDTELGYMYQRFGEQNFHSVKLGWKIRIGKN